MEYNYENIDYTKWDSRDDCFAKYRDIVSKLIFGTPPVDKPDVSVMIPTYRRADLLEQAIQSVLDQKTRYTFTISVVDNDSDGDTATEELMRRVCAKHQNVLYYRNDRNLGMYGNWNRCIELSQTEWLLLLHDDDMLMSDYLETMLPIALTGRYAIVGCYKKIIDQRNDAELHMSETGRGRVLSALMKLFILIRGSKEIPLTNKDATHALYMASMANLIHQERAICNGGIQEAYVSGDTFFYEKTMRYHRVSFLPKQLYYYRIDRNDSLRESSIMGVIISSAMLSAEIQKTLGGTERQCRRCFEETAVVVYYIWMNTKELLDFTKIAEHCQLPNKYNNVWIRRWIMAKYYLRWGLLLFRSRKYNA